MIANCFCVFNICTLLKPKNKTCVSKGGAEVLFFFACLKFLNATQGKNKIQSGCFCILEMSGWDSV